MRSYFQFDHTWSAYTTSVVVALCIGLALLYKPLADYSDARIGSKTSLYMLPLPQFFGFRMCASIASIYILGWQTNRNNL